MPFTHGYDQTEAQVTLTLSALAYANEDRLPGETAAQHQARISKRINQELGNPAYATGGEWQVVWGPALTSGNMLYVAKKTTGNQYAVAIRGTDWHFLADWIEDFDTLKLTRFPYVSSQDPDIKVAQGTMHGLTDLIGMTGSASLDGQADGAFNMSLVQFFMHVATEAKTDTDILVTGHSLGGCLASVVAPWLAFETSQWAHLSGAVNVKPYTFAAPSAGNSNFAGYYDTLFGDNAVRVYNTLDVVPNAWQTLEVIKTYYTPQPACHLMFKAVLAADEVMILRDRYTQPGNTRPLTGTVSPDHRASFVAQVEYQHSYNTYLEKLGAVPIDWLAGVQPGRQRGS